MECSVMQGSSSIHILLIHLCSILEQSCDYVNKSSSSSNVKSLVENILTYTTTSLLDEILDSLGITRKGHNGEVIFWLVGLCNLLPLDCVHRAIHPKAAMSHQDLRNVEMPPPNRSIE